MRFEEMGEFLTQTNKSQEIFLSEKIAQVAAWKQENI